MPFGEDDNDSDNDVRLVCATPRRTATVTTPAVECTAVQGSTSGQVTIHIQYI